MNKLLMTAALASLSVAPAQAATFLPTAVTATRGGGAQLNGFFGSTGSPDRTSQIDFAAALLGSGTGKLPTGSLITGMAVRLAYYSATVATPITLDQFDIRIGSSANPINALSRNFSDNLGADTILARSGALAIAANELKGAGTNSSRPGTFYTFSFDTPYLYTGGDLLLTITSHLTSELANGPYLDAYSSMAATSINTVTGFDAGGTGGRGNVNAFYQPVIQLTYTTAVPEPAGWVTMIVGMGCVGATLRHRRRNAPARA